jgi:hypothetical protein
VRLIPARFTLLEGCFVFELSEVHQFADWWLCQRSYLDQVEICLCCQSQRILYAHDADLLARWTDKSDLRDANPVVDAWFDADGASLLEGTFLAGIPAPNKNASGAARTEADRRNRSRHST